MEHEPVRQYTSNGVLQKMLKEWNTEKVTPRQCYFLLKLWLGFDFANHMDDKGRWSKVEFNLFKSLFAYKTIGDFLSDIRRTHSFILVGADENIPDFIASPNWYKWQEEDGPLQPYSFGYKTEAQNGKMEGKMTCVKNIIYKKNSLPERNPDGSEAGAISDAEVHEIEVEKRLREEDVREYFRWLLEQQDEKHKNIVKDLLEAIRYPRVRQPKKGHKFKSYNRNEAEAAEFLPFLIADQLVPYFASRDIFFSERYRVNPAARCYWMSRFIKTYINHYVIVANQNWDKRQQQLRQRQAIKKQKDARNNHPRSPYEWEDAEGNRFYADESGLATMIPPEAPTREEDNTYYSTMLSQWMKN